MCDTDLCNTDMCNTDRCGNSVVGQGGNTCGVDMGGGLANGHQ
jgi:hypothetical protein